MKNSNLYLDKYLNEKYGKYGNKDVITLSIMIDDDYKRIPLGEFKATNKLNTLKYLGGDIGLDELIDFRTAFESVDNSLNDQGVIEELTKVQNTIQIYLGIGDAKDVNDMSDDLLLELGKPINIQVYKNVEDVIDLILRNIESGKKILIDKVEEYFDKYFTDQGQKSYQELPSGMKNKFDYLHSSK